MAAVRTLSVRAELVEAWACSLIWQHAFAKGGCRDVPPAGHLLFLRRQEKKAKEGDPQSATPALRYGANLRRGGCGVRRGTRFAAAQRRSDSHGESDDEAWAHWRPCHPATAPPQAQPAGGGQPNIQTATRVVAALDPVSAVPNARHLRPQDGAERSNGPDGCWLFGCSAPHPLCMRRGAQRPADQGSRLSERSEFERDPAGREHRRLPEAKRRDADSGVAFSLLTFFWRSKRK